MQTAVEVHMAQKYRVTDCSAQINLAGSQKRTG